MLFLEASVRYLLSIDLPLIYESFHHPIEQNIRFLAGFDSPHGCVDIHLTNLRPDKIIALSFSAFDCWQSLGTAHLTLIFVKSYHSLGEGVLDGSSMNLSDSAWSRQVLQLVLHLDDDVISVIIHRLH
jgi:hypothetical protein